MRPDFRRVVPFGEASGESVLCVGTPDVAQFDHLAGNLTVQDAAEIALHGLSPLAALQASLEGAQRVWGIYIGDSLEGLLGLNPAQQALPERLWFMSTAKAWRYPVTMIRIARAILADLELPVVCTAVDETNTELLRFIELIGFESTNHPSIHLWHSDKEPKPAH